MNHDKNTKFPMKHIYLISTLDSTFSQHVLEQLSGKFGLSQEFLHHVVGRAAPALVAALMESAASAQGTALVFAAIMSAEVNPRIAEHFQEVVATTTGFKALEDAGQSFVREAVNVGPADLSDFVAANSGIPTQAAYAMTGLVAAMLSGVLKHHLLLEQGSVSALPRLLADQWPSIESDLTDTLAIVLRFEDAAAFRDTIPTQLRVLSGNLERAAADSSPVGSSSAYGRKAPAEVTPDDHPSKPRERRRSMVGLLALAIAAVAIVYGSYYYHPSQSATVRAPDQPAQKANAPAAAASGTAASDLAVAGTVASVAMPVSDAAASDVGSASAPAAASQACLEEHTHNTRFVFGVNRVGAAILSATVASEAEKNRLLELLDRSLGAGHYTGDITIDPRAVAADWLTQIEALMPLMRISGADMTIDGQNIELGGVAGALGSPWASRIHELFGPAYKLSVFDPAEAVSAATVTFKMALDNQTKTGSCDAVDRVLNLQVIDFARGSTHVPATATRNLDETAQLLKTCRTRGQTVTLTIESFSDNIGEARANLDLSTKRAEAVRAYLIQAGVPAASLVAQGYGVVQPIASNLTERGRFANRRIVFAVRP